jgi:RNA polymerase sigma-70 factor, ECF subfamily
MHKTAAERNGVSTAVEVLISRAKSGDQDALGRLSYLYRDYLLQIATRKLGNRLRAKVASSDLVQDVLLDFPTTIAQLRGESEADLRRYLRQVILNRVARAGRYYCHTAMRNVGREVSIGEGSAGNGSVQGGASLTDFALTPLTRLVANEENLLLQAALGRLPHDYRRVIELRDLAGKPWNEVGTTLGRSADAARQLWYRAIAELRVVWEQGENPKA